MRTVQVTKYAFRIRTRLGLIIDNLMIHGEDALQAQKKLRQIHPRCEVLECVCHQGSVRVPVSLPELPRATAMR